MCRIFSDKAERWLKFRQLRRMSVELLPTHRAIGWTTMAPPLKDLTIEDLEQIEIVDDHADSR